MESSGSPEPVAESRAESLGVDLLLEGFRGMGSPFLSWMFRVLPWVLILGSALVLLRTGLLYFMYASWIFTVAINILVFNHLIREIPEDLGLIWDRGVVSAIKTSGERSGEGGDCYSVFIKEFQRLLNHQARWASGLLFWLVVSIRSFYEFWISLPYGLTGWIPLQAGGLSAYWEYFKLQVVVYFTVYMVEKPLEFFAGAIIEPIIGLVVGIVVWKIAVIGWMVWHLDRYVELHPLQGHEDGGGGLGPLAEICFLNALIVTISGLFLALWIVLGRWTPCGEVYTPLFQMLLPIPLVLALLCFVVPLLEVHEGMVASRREARAERDKLSLEVQRIGYDLSSRARGLSTEDIEASVKRLDLLQKVYEKGSSSPVWPFNLRILMKFATTQTLPLLVLISALLNVGPAGLYEPLMRSLESLMGFLGQI
ncbi:MAG: hypothetical protein JW986_01885 [Methanotrichaceae archaeon]|nr:hypothetical protein [Methanotrichaceae archaeon]